MLTRMVDSPEAQVRLEQLTRRLALLERRVGAHESTLRDAQAALHPVGDAARAAAEDEARAEDFEGRVDRLERRGFSERPGEVSLAFARFEPAAVAAGAEVRLEVGVEGLSVGDQVRFVLERIDTATERARLQPLIATVTDARAPSVGVTWRTPALPPDAIQNYTFVVSARSVEADSTILIVRG